MQPNPGLDQTLVKWEHKRFHCVTSSLGVNQEPKNHGQLHACICYSSISDELYVCLCWMPTLNTLTE